MANLVVPATALGNVMPIPKGEWIQGVTYKPLNIVTHNNNTYIALLENVVEPPEDGDANWMLIVKGVTKADVNKLGIVKPDGTTITISEDGTITGAKQVPDNVLVAVEIGADDPDLPPLQVPGIDADRLGGELPEYFATAQSVTDVLEKIGEMDNLSTEDKNTIVAAVNEIYNNFKDAGLGSNNLDSTKWENIVKSRELPLIFYTNWDNTDELPTRYGSGIIIPGLDAASKFVLHIGGNGGNYENAYIGLLQIPWTGEPYQITWNRILMSKELPELVSNPNLLINSNFKNPINQRGQTTYTAANAYTIDRWKFNEGRMNKLVVNNGYVTLSSISTDLWKDLYQIIENYKDYIGKTLTFSAKVRTSCDYAYIRISHSEYVVEKIEPTGEWQIVRVTTVMPDNATKLHVYFTIYPNGTNQETESIDIEWAKLEVGDIPTMYVPPNPAEELVKCQKYYKKIYLHALNATQYYAQANKVYFCYHFGKMRSTSPTVQMLGTQNTNSSVTNNSFSVIPRGNAQEGWSVSKDAQYEIQLKNSENAMITVTLPNSIAVTNKDFTLVFGNGAGIEVDAEIY